MFVPASDLAGTTTAQASGRLFRDVGSRNRMQMRSKCRTQMRSCVALCVGHDYQIPRWHKGSELLYNICEESFDTPGTAALVAVAMTEAISMWGDIQVSFRLVSRSDPAAFQIKFKEANSSHPDLYAKSFLPGECNGRLVVYQNALDESACLASILAHEVGHILGLRHEFALERERQWPSVRFGRKNHLSIMNYFDHPRELHVSKQDRDELAAFYAYDGAHYRGLPVIDVRPDLSKIDKCRVRRQPGRLFLRKQLLRFGVRIN
ncbi:hypothetical protein TGAMA5MH_00770 [Trichoderma gamsii]|uniref:Peptidase metallopeptidase domain-containing protein n=1 Tax=Trichoderma gamsii TaxID=398673 RepID=A0A2K0TRG0_9HYPO|nr:hypothetical protein TGAMA5MH_00770 [Trichoderma gamsii]